MKVHWQSSPDASAVDDTEDYLEFDFRLGGHERFGFSMPNGLTYTEHGAFLEGIDDPVLREEGTAELLTTS